MIETSGVNPVEAERPRSVVRLIALSWAPLSLVFLSVLFRWPPLLNAAGVHSDAAIVGLQAQHVLQGQWSWFLWGAGYQGIADVVALAAGFAVLGPRPWVLMAVPLLLHLILVQLAYLILRRRLGVARAFTLSLFLVFTPQAINGVALYAPRQAAITFVFAAIALIDSAASAKRPLLHWVLGAWMCIAALYSDLFTLQMVAPVLAFAALAWFDGRPAARVVAARAITMFAALGVGIALLWWVRQMYAGPTPAPTRLSLDRIAPNWKLLREECLPWVMSYGVWVPGATLYPGRWAAPVGVRAVQELGAALLGLGVLSGAVFLFVRQLPWEVRRLGVLGFVGATASFAGFLVSTMPSDMWSARYLAPIVWLAPFALAPVASRLTVKGFAVLFAPYVVSAALGGWLSFGPYVHGALPVQTARGAAIEEQRFGDLLRARGIHHGYAQYWLSYRLSFLWGEDPLMVPLNPSEDRYAPYRRTVESADSFALVFHPSEPRASPAMFEGRLRATHTAYERVDAYGFTALIVHRR